MVYVVFRVLAGLLGVLFLLSAIIFMAGGLKEKVAWSWALLGVMFIAYGVFGWAPKRWRASVFGGRKQAEAESQFTSRRRIVYAIGAACAVTFVHFVTELTTWAVWDAAPVQGKPYPHPMPVLWPVVSFPVFPLYHLVSGGDRAMFGTFWPCMIGNSTFWGAMAAATLLVLTRRHVVRAVEGRCVHRRHPGPPVEPHVHRRI